MSNPPFLNSRGLPRGPRFCRFQRRGAHFQVFNPVPPVVVAPGADLHDVERIRFTDQHPRIRIDFQERHRPGRFFDAAMTAGGVCHGAGVVVCGFHGVLPLLISSWVWYFKWLKYFFKCVVSSCLDAVEPSTESTPE